MNPDRQQALDYLRAPLDGPWRWTEEGSVVVWRDGVTIAFREEIIQVLEALAHGGLPSFGAIVFLLAACRGKVPAVQDILRESTSESSANAGSKAAVLQTARQQLTAQLQDALAQLSRVAQLPEELRSGTKAKCLLAGAVFEPAKVERYVNARLILRGMQGRLGELDSADSDHPASSQFVRQIHMVAEGLRRHSTDSLALRLRTGLDALPGEPDTALPSAERARKLIEELSRDRNHGAMARAARELMAAVRLPRRLGDRDELAIGGVADLTNRGPLDRLLLSELAYDDLTLAVRVALNEALYLRREPPVREPPGTLAVLLDSGIRLWGVPRVLATAVALALIARDRQHAAIQVWRAHGRKLEEVDLLSRNGLVRHLGALETDAHPGESLAGFAESIGSDAHGQSVLITHRDVLEDPEFRRALADQPVAPGFLATVDREGRFELHALPLSRRPPLCEAALDLAAIFREETGVVSVRKKVDPELPAILGVSPFPFLLPLNGRMDYWIKAEDGFNYGVLQDRRLVRFRDHQLGARVLSDQLPGGATLWMGLVDGAIHVVKNSASQRPARLVSLALPDGEPRATDLATGSTIFAVHCAGEVILVIREHDVRAHALNDGRLLGKTPSPHRWLHGRFFRGANEFYFVLWDGASVRFEPVMVPKPFSPSVIACVFDREGLEGPWLVHKGGSVISSASGEKRPLPMPAQRSFGLDTVRISRDGHRLCFGLSGASWSAFKDLQSDKSQALDQNGATRFNLDPPPQLPNWNLYRVFEQIAVQADGLALCGRQERWRKIIKDPSGELSLVDLPSGTVNSALNVSFANQPTPTRHGCMLQAARWPNGSQAFLDSRGLLHLKSHDPSLPEISLVLAQGPLAGWTSDGFVCGPGFFFDGPRPSEPKQVFERLLQFLARL